MYGEHFATIPDFICGRNASRSFPKLTNAEELRNDDQRQRFEKCNKRMSNKEQQSLNMLYFCLVQVCHNVYHQYGTSQVEQKQEEHQKHIKAEV